MRFSEESRPSTESSQKTPDTNTSSANATTSTPDLYVESYNFVLSKNIQKNLVESLISENAVLKEISDASKYRPAFIFSGGI